MVEPVEPLHTLTVNLAVTPGPDGRYLLMVKGDKFPEKGPPRIQAVGIGRSPTGPFEIQPKPAIADFDTEDASLWYDQTRRRFYACFHAHTHFGMITSTDGTSWNKARHVGSAGHLITLPGDLPCPISEPIKRHPCPNSDETVPPANNYLYIPQLDLCC